MKAKVVSVLRSVKEVFVFLGITVAVALAFTFSQFKMVMKDVEQININPFMPAIIFISAILYVFLVVRRFRKQQKSWGKELLFVKLNPKPLINLIFLGVFLNLAFAALLMLFTQWEPFQSLFLKHESSMLEILKGVPFVFLLVAVGIVMPLMEEILFRGFMQNELAKVYSAGTVVMIQAILYALLHMEPIQVAYTFMLGMLLGFLRNRTGTLTAPIAVHLSFNLINLLLVKNTQFDLTTALVLFLCSSAVTIWLTMKTKRMVDAK